MLRRRHALVALRVLAFTPAQRPRHEDVPARCEFRALFLAPLADSAEDSFMPTAAADAETELDSALAPATSTCDVGMIGLGVIGQNLALNLADHGYRVAVWDRHGEVTGRFIADLLGEG